MAIKISHENFSERFDREARSIAALNHPNICHLYDVGPNYLVMELIDGEPIIGPLPLATTLNYAKQIADALEAAHERGIIHRDLKPANILITSRGVIKVLDFGLAKNAETPASNPESSPTMTISPTRAGMILGTAAYMAPEQARGKPVDTRADVWAFGVVLHEVVTGKRLFEGETVSDILAGVLKSEPDFSSVPPQVRRLLRSCLQKDARQRLHDIGDWKLLLDEAPAQTVAPAVRKRRWPSPAINLDERIDGLDDQRPEAFIFPTKHGTPLNVSNYLNQVLKPALKRARTCTTIVQLDHIDHRLFRRSCATYMGTKGSTVKDVQKHLRHSNPQMTAGTYMQEIPSSVRAAVDQLCDLLSSSRAHSEANCTTIAHSNLKTPLG